jgi:urease accessory protein
MTPGAAEAATDGGGLDLGFERDAGGRTFIGRQYAAYPFHVCRPHYLDRGLPGLATLYVQSSAGGIYESDRHEITVTTAPESQAHVTTQASTIVHRTTADHAVQQVRLDASAGSLLEFVPDPMILFPGARLFTRLDVTIDETSVVILGDAYIGHDPEGDNRPFGWVDNRTQVRTAAGSLLVLDRFVVEGSAWQQHNVGVLGRYAAQATLMVLAAAVDPAPLVAAIRRAVADRPGLYAGASELPRRCGAWARLLATDGATLKSALSAGWMAAHEALTGHPPAPRRK